MVLQSPVTQPQGIRITYIGVFIYYELLLRLRLGELSPVTVSIGPFVNPYTNIINPWALKLCPCGLWDLPNPKPCEALKPENPVKKTR